jgi:hypothetical protein
MVNYRDPAKVARDICTFALSSVSETWRSSSFSIFFTGTVVKLWHTVDGLFMWVFPVTKTYKPHVAYPSIFSWEFFTTLDYEWSVFRRRRPYQWSIWVRI